MAISWTIKAFDDLTSLELYQVLQLRIDVFMLEQTCLYRECDDKDLPAYHLFASDDHQIVAYARLLPQHISYPDLSIGRVVVHQAYRKLGLGKQLMQQALDFWEQQEPGATIRISAQVYLQRFYEEHGFSKSSEMYLEDGIPHIEMRRN